VTAFEQSSWSSSEPAHAPALWPEPTPLEPVSDVGVELSEKLQRLLEAVDGLGESQPAGTDPDVIEGDPVADAHPESAPLHPVETSRELPERADQSPPGLIIKYDAGVELRFSGQSAVFLERLLRVSADLDALARALPPAGGGEAGVAEPSAR
jgi:hypothetical protein